MLFLIGTTRAELDGSLWAGLHGHLGGLPPVLDLAAEKVLAEIMVAASRDGLTDAARDVSEGGLAAAVALGALRYGVGARVVLDEIVERDGVTPAQAWLSESQGRVLVTVPRSEEPRFTAMLEARGLPFARIGVTQDEPVIEVQGQFTLSLEDLRAQWEATIPARFA